MIQVGNPRRGSGATTGALGRGAPRGAGGARAAPAVNTMVRSSACIAASSAFTMAPASGKRCSGANASARSITATISGVTPGLRARSAAAASHWAARPAPSVPNGFSPVRSWNPTTPRLNTSEAGESFDSPLSCSGDA